MGITAAISAPRHAAEDDPRDQRRRVIAGRLDTSTVGEHTFTATGLSGNTITRTIRYTVVLSFFSFRPPVDNQPTLNVGEAGSAIPVKWVLQDAPGKKLDDSARSRRSRRNRSLCPKVPTDAIEETTTPAPVTPTFDAASGQFIFTWQTQKAWAGTCRRLHLTLLDGSIHDADFQFSNAKKEPRRSGALNR